MPIITRRNPRSIMTMHRMFWSPYGYFVFSFVILNNYERSSRTVWWICPPWLGNVWFLSYSHVWIIQMVSFETTWRICSFVWPKTSLNWFSIRSSSVLRTIRRCDDWNLEMTMPFDANHWVFPVLKKNARRKKSTTKKPKKMRSTWKTKQRTTMPINRRTS